LVANFLYVLENLAALVAPAPIGRNIVVLLWAPRHYVNYVLLILKL
jgi:hypothetical protein